MRCTESVSDPRAVARSLRELPLPDSAAQEVSAALLMRIREEIAHAGGVLPFERYMALALYAPGLGYYSGGSRKFGEGGDFVTAPELSPLYSRCLARQCKQILDALGGADVLEFGAGSGVMAADMLAELEQLGSLPDHYYILEVSGELRLRQQETLQARAPHLAARILWLDTLPEQFRGVIVGNEVLDAMPVERFRIVEGKAVELGVAWHDGQLCDAPLAHCSAPLAERVAVLQQEVGLGEGYSSEVNLAAEEWIKTLAGVLDAGAVLLIDYGFARREYYHPQRFEGTLMCHYRHRAHGDPYWLPGLQDITAHVDFTAVAEAAQRSGLHVAGYSGQANFLLASGLLEMAAEPREVRAQMECANQVRRLTLPGEMGELFKVMALTRNLDMPLLGFLLRDERGRL